MASVSLPTVVNNTKSNETLRLRNLLELCLLDGPMAAQGQNKPFKARLRKISPLISRCHFFDSGDQLQSYLNDNPDKKLITIMSGSFARQMLALVSEKTGLHGVYVFTPDIERNTTALGSDPKLRGIFNTEETVLEQLEKDLVQLFLDECYSLARSNDFEEARLYFNEAERLSKN